MRLVRRLVIAALTYNIVFRAKHIKGKTNVIADYLSRSQYRLAIESFNENFPAEISALASLFNLIL
jgi:hypothetical protein